MSGGFPQMIIIYTTIQRRNPNYTYTDTLTHTITVKEDVKAILISGETQI